MKLGRTAPADGVCKPPASQHDRFPESCDRKRIRGEVAALIEGMQRRGARYIFHSDHSLSTNVDYDDYRFALAVYREHMSY